MRWLNINIQMILNDSENASIGTKVCFHLILNLHVQGLFFPNAKTGGVSNRNIDLLYFWGLYVSYPLEMYIHIR